MKWLLNRCGRHRGNLILLAGGALPKQESTGVENHLAGCAGCRKYYDEIKRMTAPLANWERSLAHVEPDQTLRMRWTKAVQAAGKPGPVRRFAPATIVSAIWRELIWPCRRAWAGMAALWLVLWAVNSGMSDAPQAAMTARAPSTAEMFQALEEQRRTLAELLPPANSQPAEPRRHNTQPRSERRLKVLTV